MADFPRKVLVLGGSVIEANAGFRVPNTVLAPRDALKRQRLKNFAPNYYWPPKNTRLFIWTNQLFMVADSIKNNTCA